MIDKRALSTVKPDHSMPYLGQAGHAFFRVLFAEFQFVRGDLKMEIPKEKYRSSTRRHIDAQGIFSSRFADTGHGIEEQRKQIGL